MISTEYKTDGPTVWVQHNSDFSGIAYVYWNADDDGDIEQWMIDGPKLLTGSVGEPVYHSGVTLTRVSVPVWVVARAVMTAVRFSLTTKIINLVEQL